MMSLIASHPDVMYIMMYCKNPSGHADSDHEKNPKNILSSIQQFFDETIYKAHKSGIKTSQIILDPGMGSFISTEPQDSILVLQSLTQLKKIYHLPILVGTSRKGFLGKISPDI